MTVKERELLEKIAPSFNQFLKQGKKFKLSSFSQEIDPNLNIKDIQRLLRIHFVLTRKSEEDNNLGVIDFVSSLPERLRRIKTTVELKSIFLDGEVKGKIDWYKTVQMRYNRDPKSKTHFICNQTERNYDIPENLVLKRLLQIINGIIVEDLQYAIENKYDWIHEWIDDKQLKEVLKSVYLRNIYLKRINLEDVVTDERMINRAMKSRTPLYREAAELLSRYNKLMNYEIDSNEAKSLLKNTFIRPGKITTLFELYWVIEMIQQFKDVQLQLLDEGSTCVAKWTHNGYSYEIYHNSSAGFNFETNINNPPQSLSEGDYFVREFKSIKKFEELAQEKYFGNLRPDIIVIIKNPVGIIDLIFIGEVKYTINHDYALQGLKELLTYVSLIQEQSGHIDRDNAVFSSSGRIRGCLFVDDIPNFSIKHDECIRCIKFSDGVNTLIDLLEIREKENN